MREKERDMEARRVEDALEVPGPVISGSVPGPVISGSVPGPVISGSVPGLGVG